MDQKLLSAFHVRLLRLETDIENITQALTMREKLGDKVEDRAANLRREAENLRGMLRTFAGLQPESLSDTALSDMALSDMALSAAPSASPHPRPHAPAPAPAPTPAPTPTLGAQTAPAAPRTRHEPPAPGTRAGRLDARRRRGVRFQVRVDIWDHDLEALVRSGELSATEAQDPDIVAEAVEDIFDRWLQNRLGAAPAAAPAPSRPSVAPPPPPPAPPRPPAGTASPLASGETRSGDGPGDTPGGDAPSQDDRRRNADRRAGLERRGDDDRRSRAADAGSDEWGILMDDNWGGPDVRSPDDRRAGIDRRGNDRRRVVGPFS